MRDVCSECDGYLDGGGICAGCLPDENDGILEGVDYTITNSATKINTSFKDLGNKFINVGTYTDALASLRPCGCPENAEHYTSCYHYVQPMRPPF